MCLPFNSHTSPALFIQAVQCRDKSKPLWFSLIEGFRSYSPEEFYRGSYIMDPNCLRKAREDFLDFWFYYSVTNYIDTLRLKPKFCVKLRCIYFVLMSSVSSFNS